MDDFAFERYQKWKDEMFDGVILNIKHGTIKTGRKAGLIKLNKKEKVKLKGTLLGNK